MQRQYYGVVTKTGKGFILFTHKNELNLSEELKHYWQIDVPVHIKIESDTRKLLEEDKCEIYYDKNKYGKYKFHINGRNIEDEILESAIGKQLYITVNVEREDSGNGTENLHKS